ncbi:hypothetical protein PR202_gb24981 [Eleusine coracana subsp. coracana]|uniref:RNA polymerase II subunit B1 CTD phosphatase RPAP2 homolog n=1 Tax=Eleusine coracana subsp. coracana TaxID=191504 RepID=A0AAV5FMY4_ELECO|nr:hypothetical protein PR202_gb24981 [Eleusine coracana subsp. coracana]
MAPAPSPDAAATGLAPGTVSWAVLRVQTALLDGRAANNEPLLHAAAPSLLSRSDYDDVVTERTISNECGYPACPNPLPPPAPGAKAAAPRFHISLREHRVYDLEEARKFCSERCLVASAAFAASLPPERPFGVPPDRLDALVALVESGGGLGLGFPAAEDGKKEGKAMKVEIKEKEVAGAGEVTLLDWIGPSDAIEGYVPRRDRAAEGPKPEAKPNKVAGSEQSRSKTLDSRNAAPDKDGMSTSSSSVETHVNSELENVVLEEKKSSKKKKASKASSKAQKTEDSMQAHTEQLQEEFSRAVNIGKDETSDVKTRPALKSSLKVSGSKSGTQSVTWADENGSVLEITKPFESHSSGVNQFEGIDSSLRRASAEACAAALIKAAEAISSGTSGVEDAGIIILPDRLHQEQLENEKNTDGDDEFEIDRGIVKWPKKTVLMDTDMFEVDDSWHDTPPEGFSLTLSAFATMWSALFGWVSRSSLAYVYGLDGDSVEEMLIANGREYPEKKVLKDGHSSEIRRALDTCVCNAVPVLISNLKLQTPLSKLELTLGYLIDTMSFVDALPPLRARQWQLMVLVLLDALSIHRLPALAPIMSNYKLMQKMLNAAQVSREEYDSMIDLILPFGRSVQTPAP